MYVSVALIECRASDGGEASMVDGGGELTPLFHTLVAARAAVEGTRRTTTGSQATVATNARRDLLDALEAYAAALGRRGQPVPYRVRDELALYRSMVRLPRLSDQGASGAV
jgi:hypothetical protein